MAEQQDKGLWLIAIRGTSAYLGRCEDIKENIVSTLGCDPITMHNVCTVNVEMMPTQQGLARHAAAYPFLNTLAGAPLHLVPDAVQFLDEMIEADQARYKSMAEKSTDIARDIRAQESGLSLTGRMPPGDGPPNT